ncbi:MAG: glycoside hydrolase family 16 protein [Rikenellaceae bacterium]
MYKRLYLVLTLFVAMGCQSIEASDTLPDASMFDVTVDCDQSTNVVTFTFHNDDMSPIWHLGDDEVSSEKVVEKFYPYAGDYKVEVWGVNKYGMSEESRSYEFTLENDFEGEKYELAWSDEFDGNALDTTIWHLEQGYIANNELQNYQTSGNHKVSDGTLKIIARKVNDNKEYGSYTSARMISYYGDKSFTYGRIEARIKVPAGVGTWPAFWMLGDAIMEGGGWPSCGEIDIMEHVGYEPYKSYATIHYVDNTSNYTYTSSSTQSDSEEAWLTYGVIWQEESMEFYLDDPENIYATYTTPANKTNWPFDAPHFLLLNLAIGGDWGGVKGVDNTIFDATGYIVMEVDYVRVYNILY